MAKKKKKTAVNRKLFIGIVVAALVLGAFMEWLCFFELKHYEDSFLLVYGMEQDGYVQVTIDQINRLGPNATEAQITDIISSIDTSAKGYWTLTSEDDILFVKSVTETSKYKNLSADSYYNMDSSKAFIASLSTDRVIHDIIFINNDRYIASGGQFEWHGRNYTVCLMTYDYAILNQNALMEAKNVVTVMVTIMVAVFICAIMISVRIISKNLVRIAQFESNEVNLNMTIMKLQDQINTYEAFTSKFHTYYPKAIPVFLRSLYRKDVGPLHVVLLRVKDKTKVEDYLQKMLMATDENTLRFMLDEEHIMVILPGIDELMGEQMAAILATSEVEIVKTEHWDHDYISYIRKFNRMMEVDDYAGTAIIQGIQDQILS